MSRDFPTTDNLSWKIAALCEQLESVEQPRKRLPLLDELSSLCVEVDPVKGAAYAREQLRLARSVKDEYWIAKSCIQSAEYARIRSRYSHAVRYLNKAGLLLQRSSGHFSEKSQIYRMQGVLCGEQKGDFSMALPLFGQALELARHSKNRRDIGSTLLLIAETSYKLGLFDNTLDGINECLGILGESVLPDLRGGCFRLLGMVYTRLEDWDQALNRVNRSLEIFQEIGSHCGKALSSRELGLIYLHQQDYNRALNVLQAAVAFFEKTGQPRMQALVLTDLCRVYVALGKTPSALNFCTTAQELHGRIGSPETLAILLTAKGEALMADGAWPQAICELEEALKVLQGGELVFERSLIHQLLARSYESISRPSDALTHHKKFAELRQRLLNKDTQRKLLEFEFRKVGEGTDDSLREEADRSTEQAAASLRLAAAGDLLSKLKERILRLENHGGNANAVIQDIVREIDANRDAVQVWRILEQHLVQADHVFLRRLITEHPGLTPAELRICSLLRMNFSNKEISDMLNVSGRTIDTHRTSIRKKMGLKKRECLVDALAHYEALDADGLDNKVPGPYLNYTAMNNEPNKLLKRRTGATTTGNL